MNHPGSLAIVRGLRGAAFRPGIAAAVLSAARRILALSGVVMLAGCAMPNPGMTKEGMEEPESFYLPDESASRVVTVTHTGQALANILVQTHAVAVKESGPRESVARFGEVYAFSPAFIAVHREEPTLIRFWNLQADDQHDFMLIDPRSRVLMKVRLPALEETSYVFTFHEEGLFNFVCAMHQPSMNGQILVLPPRTH
jgi:plastocyanin